MELPASQPGLGFLPDAVLVEVFGALDVVQRHKALPLVCRRWEQLLLAPQLLRRIELDLSGNGRTLHRLRGLTAWLLRRAASKVQSLHLYICAPSPAAAAEHQSEPGEPAGVLPYELVCTELLLKLTAAVIKSLHFSVEAGRDYSHNEWGEPELIVEGPLAALTALKELSLCRCGAGRSTLFIDPAASLPSQLTKLSLGALQDLATLPRQLHSEEAEGLRVWLEDPLPGSKSVLAEVAERKPALEYGSLNRMGLERTASFGSFDSDSEDDDRG
ncbi:hypothetical protein ABPG75_011164 [Micractinium tetrahymenae]